MKTLLISGMYYPPVVGGLSQFTGQLATSLGKDRVCCLTGVTQQGRFAEDNGPNVYRIPSAFADSRFRKVAGWGTALTQIMLRERPDVSMLTTIDDGPLALWLRKYLGLPFVVFAAGNEILDVIAEKWPKPLRALQTANRVLAVSQYTATLVERAGVDPARIDVIYSGYDTERFRPLPPREDLRRKLLGERIGDKVILTVGNLVARKGHDVTIRALPNLLRQVPDVSYLIVGDGAYRNQLETLAVELGVRDRVIFAGKLPDEDLPDLYALSDVFIMPSRAQLEQKDVEGLGIVFLEASGCAKPVIGGKSGGVPEAIQDGVSGLLVDPGDSEDVCRALTRLLTDPEFANRLGQQGHTRAVREFSWSKVAARVHGILDSVRQEQSSS
jgi:phosphatidyl-myo-inositol dimannoside synthase